MMEALAVLGIVCGALGLLVTGAVLEACFFHPRDVIDDDDDALGHFL